MRSEPLLPIKVSGIGKRLGKLPRWQININKASGRHAIVLPLGRIVHFDGARRLIVVVQSTAMTIGPLELSLLPFPSETHHHHRRHRHLKMQVTHRSG